MDKENIREHLLNQLRENLALLVRVAHDARDAATGEESKAENKYDTRGLEASYLAGAQAKRSEELQQTLFFLEKLPLRSFSQKDKIDISALVKMAIDGDEEKYFFLLAKAGGTQFSFEGKSISVLTPDSALGSLLMGKFVDDEFELKIKNKTVNYTIMSIS